MRNLTTVTIEGFATRDPLLKKTKTGKSVCTFSIAVNHSSKDDVDQKVSYLDVETWERLAEICSGNITQGRRIMVHGELRQDRWEGKDGKTRSRIKIVGNEIRFLESILSRGEAVAKTA